MKRLLTLLVLTAVVLTANVNAQWKTPDWMVDPTSTNAAPLFSDTTATLKDILEYIGTGMVHKATASTDLPTFDDDKTDDVTLMIDGGTVGSIGEIIRNGDNTYEIRFPSPLGASNTLMKSGIEGLWCWGCDSNTVYIEAGECYGNGSYYKQAVTTSYDVVNMTAIGDWHYLYIDDSRSLTNAPAITFTNTATEPAYSGDKMGWYNGDDRCIGSFYVTNSVLNLSNNLERTYDGMIAVPRRANLVSGDPSGYWQSFTVPTSETLPVNATLVAFDVRIGADSKARGFWMTSAGLSNTSYQASSLSYEVNNAMRGYRGVYGTQVDVWYLPVPKSREFVWQGEEDDKGWYSVYTAGYREDR